MDVLNWMAEHYVLTFFLGCFAVGIAHGIGPKSTVRISNERKGE